MSDPTFLADGSGIAPHIPLAKVRKVGLGGETAHVGYFLQRVVCRPQQLPDTFDTCLLYTSHAHCNQGWQGSMGVNFSSLSS